MSKLTNNPFQFVSFSVLLIIVVCTTEVSAQFDSLMFLDAGYYLNESCL